MSRFPGSLELLGFNREPKWDYSLILVHFTISLKRPPSLLSNMNPSSHELPTPPPLAPVSSTTNHDYHCEAQILSSFLDSNFLRTTPERNCETLDLFRRRRHFVMTKWILDLASISHLLVEEEVVVSLLENFPFEAHEVVVADDFFEVVVDVEDSDFAEVLEAD
ncbi:hypothetical protein V6N11_012266 [Hibiscus sabdariffa]|uniref:Uncharacterized protein n=1 Tax=Hibiscus sabdariffa TaxID=183260 RepID=A0ABR2QB35_9ROSI